MVNEQTVKYLSWFLSVVFVVACAQNSVIKGPIESGGDASPDVVTLDHSFFIIQYSKTFRLPKSVRYALSAENLKRKVATRKNRFAPDPILARLNLHPVMPREYRASGYDRGHMAPSADFEWSQEANDTTFLMSNMAPQSPGLNHGAWKRLEERVREWACGEDRVIVITGPILESDMPTLASGLPIPRAFYKVIVDDTPPRKVLALVYRQDDQGDVMNERFVNVEEVESRSGQTFSQEVPTEDRAIFRTAPAPSTWKTAKCDATNPPPINEVARTQGIRNARPR